MFSTIDFSVVAGAAWMAILSMVSMVIGVVIGIHGKPSQRTNAIIMAFGTGALIQALALELAYEGAERLVNEVHLPGIIAWAWVAGGFIAGGAIYYIGNRILDQKGAALRHPALAKLYALNKKRELSEAVLEQLSRVELLRLLPPDEIEEVLLTVQPRKVKAGDVLFKEGEPADALYLIDDGTIDILSGTWPASRNTVPLAHLGPGQSFGEMALLARGPRTASAIAATDGSLLRIDKVHFDELIDRSPRLRRAVEELNSRRLVANVEASQNRIDADHWKSKAVENIQRMTRTEERDMIKSQAAAGAPLAIFIGAMMDTIPESIVIGSSFTSFSTFDYTFLAAVFVANLPEAMASAVVMKEAEFPNYKIYGLWGVLILAGAIAAAVGNMFLLNAPPTVLTLVGAFAGGAILAMVSSVMMPEAYEDGGPSVGLATIGGFLAAFLFSYI